MSKPKVSVIIPVYNTQQYLKRCLDSVLSQKLEDIEVICVNDGSTDASGMVLNEYAQRDSRIKVIHKPNGGLVSARKAGVEAACGEYIGYVDSDDYIEPDMYENLYKTANTNNVDLVTCGYMLEGNYTTTHLDTVEEGLYAETEMPYLRENTIYRLEKRETGLRGSLCCKLFRTDIIKRVQGMIPDNISIAEDKVCLFRYILECTSVYVLKKSYYHWVIRQASMSHVSQENHNDYLVRVNNVYNYFMTLYEHPNFTDTMRTQIEIYITELLFLGINKRMGFQNKNLIWIDPYWLEKLPVNSRIVLYGAGELGDKYKKQMCTRPDLQLVSCVGLDDTQITQLEFDYIVITIKNPEKQRQCEQN